MEDHKRDVGNAQCYLLEGHNVKCKYLNICDMKVTLGQSHKISTQKTPIGNFQLVNTVFDFVYK